MSTFSPFAVAEPWDLVADGDAAEAALIMAPFSRRAIELACVPEGAKAVDVAAVFGLLAPEPQDLRAEAKRKGDDLDAEAFAQAKCPSSCTKISAEMRMTK